MRAHLLATVLFVLAGAGLGALLAYWFDVRGWLDVKPFFFGGGLLGLWAASLASKGR